MLPFIVQALAVGRSCPVLVMVPVMTCSPPRQQAAESFDEDLIISLTKHEDARIRKRALKELCPCHVKDDVPAFWERVFGTW